MTKDVFDLYCRAIKGHSWLETNENAANYEVGLKRYEKIVDELGELGFPEYPEVVTHDPNNRFGFPNRTYHKTLSGEDFNNYTKFKFEESCCLIDEGYFKEKLGT